MKNVIFQILILSVLFSSCNGQPPNRAKTNANYIKYKAEFDSKLTEHFPKNLTTFPNEVIRNTNLSKNDVCFILYEYDVDTHKIDSITNHLKKHVLATYTSDTNCLLVVNRFETSYSYENMEVPEIKDSTAINKDCFSKRYPIPNFIDYNHFVGASELKLPNDFFIYVFEAKSGIFFKDFNLKPNPQMPDNWKNGYSKGLAFSKEKKTLIFWSIIW